jgi:uncharacterized membrane protein YoaK (UPF0700 family)
MENDTRVLLACIVVIIVLMTAGLYLINEDLQGAASGICPLPFGSGVLNAEVQELNQEGVNATLMTVGNLVYMVLPNDTLPVGWNC